MAQIQKFKAKLWSSFRVITVETMMAVTNCLASKIGLTKTMGFDVYFLIHDVYVLIVFDKQLTDRACHLIFEMIYLESDKQR